MINIVKPSEADAELLTELGIKTFLQSHGHCGPKEDVENYVAKTYTVDQFRQNIKDPSRELRLLVHKNGTIGYSEIQLNSPCPNLQAKNVAKLNRLYLLADYHSLNLGAELFEYNLNFAKQHQQLGMWLYVWKKNERAVRFYQKKGFSVVGSHDFKISERHSNPNHIMVMGF